MESRGKEKTYFVKILLSMLAGYSITIVGIVIVAFLLYFFQLSENTVNIGIIILYVLSSMGAGVTAGKQFGLRKFLWGMLTGVVYYLLLVLISAMSGQSLAAQGQELITTFLLCTGGGMLGGMIS